MPSLKSLRDRIKSVRATEKITSAMKMVAAAKFRQCQRRLEECTPYMTTVTGMLNHIGGHTPAFDSEVTLKDLSLQDKHLIILLTGDRGLCGAFNMNLIKKAQQFLHSTPRYEFMCIGNKGFDYFKKETLSEFQTSRMIKSTHDFTIDHIKELVKNLISRIESEELKTVKVVYAHFHSALNQETKCVSLLPIPVVLKEKSFLYDFEPSVSHLEADLLERYCVSRLYWLFKQTLTSEQAARMSAMDNSSRNASDMIKKLKIVYNRNRQAIITKELTEIISGSESLK